MNTQITTHHLTPTSETTSEAETRLASPQEGFLLTIGERRSADVAWHALLDSGKAQSHDFALHALLRDRDPLKGFAPICNSNKLANGQRPYQAYSRALSRLLNNTRKVMEQACPLIFSREDENAACAEKAIRGEALLIELTQRIKSALVQMKAEQGAVR